MAYEQGTPDRVPPDQPDPVMVGPGLSMLGEGAYKKASSVTPAVVTDGKPNESAAKEDGASYFSDVPGTASTTTKDAYAKSPATPAEAASGATSGPELLRRLSLVGGGLTPASPTIDPRTAHPGLKLSGRIISAAFCIPYKVAFEPGSDWVRTADGMVDCRRADWALGIETPTRHVRSLRLVRPSCLRQVSVVASSGRLDGRGGAHSERATASAATHLSKWHSVSRRDARTRACAAARCAQSGSARPGRRPPETQPSGRGGRQGV